MHPWARIMPACNSVVFIEMIMSKIFFLYPSSSKVSIPSKNLQVLRSQWMEKKRGIQTFSIPLQGRHSVSVETGCCVAWRVAKILSHFMLSLLLRCVSLLEASISRYLCIPCWGDIIQPCPNDTCIAFAPLVHRSWTKWNIAKWRSETTYCHFPHMDLLQTCIMWVGW